MKHTLTLALLLLCLNGKAQVGNKWNFPKQNDTISISYAKPENKIYYIDSIKGDPNLMAAWYDAQEERTYWAIKMSRCKDCDYIIRKYYYWDGLLTGLELAVFGNNYLDKMEHK